jgi:hypothetical protein
MPGMPSTTIQLPRAHVRNDRPHILRRTILAVWTLLGAINAALEEAERRQDEAKRRYPYLNFDE